MEKLYEKLRKVYAFWKSIKAKEISASLTFYILTGIVPLLCVLLVVIGEKFSNVIFKNLHIAYELEQLYKSFESNAFNAISSGGIIFFGTIIYSSVNLFYRFKKCGEVLYGVESKNPLIKRLFSFFTLGLTVVIFAVFMAGCFIAESLFIGVYIRVFIFISLIFVSEIILIVLNFSVCPYKLKFNDVFFGSLTTLVLWCAITVFFTIYLKDFANFSKLYGAVGGVFALMLYVYLLMQAFTFGVAINIMRLGKLKRCENRHNSSK